MPQHRAHSHIILSDPTIENEIDKIYRESSNVFNFIKSNIDTNAIHQEILKKSFDNSLIIWLEKILDTHLSHLKINDDKIFSSTIKKNDEIKLLQENIRKLENEKNNLLVDKYELSIKKEEVSKKLRDVFKIIEDSTKNFTFQFIEKKENSNYKFYTIHQSETINHNNFVAHIINLFGTDEKDKFEFNSKETSQDFLSQLESKIKQTYESYIQILNHQLENEFNIKSKLSTEDFMFKQDTVKMNTKIERDKIVINEVTHWISKDWGVLYCQKNVYEYFMNRDDIEQQIKLFITEFEETIKIFENQIVDEINSLTDDLHHNQNILQSQIDNFIAKIALTTQELDKLNEKSLLNNTYKELVDRLHQRLKRIEIILQGIKSE